MVESVEHIQPELETYLFADREILLDTYVHVLVTRRTQVREIPRGIPEGPFRRLNECRRVKPLGKALIGDMVVANHVYVLAYSEFIPVVDVNPHREPAFEGHNAGGLPVADDCVHH